MTGIVGDVTVGEAFDKLRTEPKAQIVDVRTKAEWSFVGVPDVTGIGKEVILAEWQHYPEMEVVPDFVANLERELEGRGVGRDDAVLYLCRSGVRSLAAAQAMVQAGWSNAYNISGGFEGPPDKERHRGRVDGWKAAGLPWVQT
jgi:rhodanese-related sulfurtransferase